MKFYGIRNKVTLNPLGFTYLSNKNVECSVSVSFSFNGFASSIDNVWLVKKRETAKKVFDGEVGWFNADYDSPEVKSKILSKLIKEYEIFEIEI